ncbi:hypothetical protein ABW19_dt0205314 [Dactylella cylindrospora]|nr:hypothetical protein ABW19_dt0205314 [Dactylella cylindrospora]
MATIKNSGVFRIENLSKDVTEDDVKDALLNLLTVDEWENFEFSQFDLVPACYVSNADSQVAIFKCNSSPGPEPFLVEGGKWFDCGGRKVKLDSDFYGLTQLFPVNPDEVKMDIVAMSGLNSHAVGSWTHPKTRGTWLWEFLRRDEELKYCRVMTFGYDTKYKSDTRIWIEDHVTNFLSQLNNARRSDKERRRPLILLGHSFGGTILAHAYAEASEMPYWKDIYESIAGILFFAVPFRGINLEDVASMVRNMCSPGNQGPQLLESIKYETQRITLPIKLFKRRIAQQQTKIFTFTETDLTPEVVEV